MRHNASDASSISKPILLCCCSEQCGCLQETDTAHVELQVQKTARKRRRVGTTEATSASQSVGGSARSGQRPAPPVTWHCLVRRTAHPCVWPRDSKFTGHDQPFPVAKMTSRRQKLNGQTENMWFQNANGNHFLLRGLEGSKVVAVWQCTQWSLEFTMSANTCLGTCQPMPQFVFVLFFRKLLQKSR